MNGRAAVIVGPVDDGYLVWEILAISQWKRGAQARKGLIESQIVDAQADPAVVAAGKLDTGDTGYAESKIAASNATWVCVASAYKVGKSTAASPEIPAGTDMVADGEIRRSPGRSLEQLRPADRRDNTEAKIFNFSGTSGPSALL